MEIRRDRGMLTPAAVVDAARDEEHPLHTRFEWDDAVAGEAYRVEQARNLIRSVKIEREDKTPSDLRAFVSISRPNTPQREYVPTVEALEDPITRKLLLSEMRRDWETLRTRYQHMSEFADMIAASIEEAA